MTKPILARSHSLRVMTPTDLDEIYVLEQASYPYPWTFGILKDCLKVGYLGRILENYNKEIDAYSIMSSGGGEAHILNLCVRAELRGRGLGRYLLHTLLDDAKTLKADTVLLEVRSSNKAAITLYESTGFNELDVRHNYYPAKKGREDAIIFAKYIRLEKTS
ncbi:Ribosomal-protein-S18p-alanine acetyltransferase [hydrothermal vent metagenome]|uniref:Ribosomal-protein-S18p-alanine acetyltransferase n=1 Tax=hydrothermal vent metagenome TaxID=652676 RepID=A0A3B0ZVJ3_9ZZZZ